MIKVKVQVMNETTGKVLANTRYVSERELEVAEDDKGVVCKTLDQVVNVVKQELDETFFNVDRRN